MIGNVDGDKDCNNVHNSILFPSPFLLAGLGLCRVGLDWVRSVRCGLGWIGLGRFVRLGWVGLVDIIMAADDEDDDDGDDNQDNSDDDDKDDHNEDDDDNDNVVFSCNNQPWTDAFMEEGGG